MISVDLAVVTNVRVDLVDQESVQDYLQHEHRYKLGEERQRREERKR